MVEKRIDISNLNQDYLDIFYFKLFHFYQTKLRNSLKYLIENNGLKDKMAIEPVKFIVAFYDRSNIEVDRYIGKFDDV